MSNCQSVSPAKTQFSILKTAFCCVLLLTLLRSSLGGEHVCEGGGAVISSPILTSVLPHHIFLADKQMRTTSQPQLISGGAGE
jgi:hypothetical protein